MMDFEYKEKETTVINDKKEKKKNEYEVIDFIEGNNECDTLIIKKNKQTIQVAVSKNKFDKKIIGETIDLDAVKPI